MSAPPVTPATLVEDPERSHRPERDALGNRLVHGDNLPALRALLAGHRGAVRCVYIDPPYNTGASFDHYDDALAHAAWLEAMRARLVLLRELLHPDGLIFVQIDDRELAYLQVLMDELFGRSHRVATVVVKMSELSGVKMSHVERRLPKLKEYVLVYGRRPDASLRPIRVLKQGDKLERYLRYYTKIIRNPDDPPERWEVVPIKAYMAERGLPVSAESVREFQLAERARVVYRTNNRLLASLHFDEPIRRVTSPTGIDYIWWEGRQMLFLADHVEEYLGDLWTDISTINLNKEGGVDFRNGKKPEALVQRILELSTEPGDLVLDAYGGSGTTAAVAHKMGRRWILVEQGPHCLTHVLPRLRAVVDGEDPGGITRAVGWSGGGGFRGFGVTGDG